MPGTERVRGPEGVRFFWADGLDIFLRRDPSPEN
jgi:hypothetical protein